jgi:hypothetical protein
MIKIDDLSPILVSVYNRKEHFEKTIRLLSQNRMAKDSILYIVSDAASTENDKEIINQIRQFIFSINGFKLVIPILREINFGAHESIYQAINFVLGVHGKIIFLEDDINTSSDFLEFMNSALSFYENDNRIITVTGYAPPFKIPFWYRKDVWVNRRQCAWGFGTWKSKWDKIDFNHYDRYNELISNKANLNKYSEDGYDLVDILRCDSQKIYTAMDIRICYYQYLHDKWTLYPVKSKTYNAGFDGSGVRCGISNEYEVSLEESGYNVKFPRSIHSNIFLKLLAKSFYDKKSVLEIIFPLPYKLLKIFKSLKKRFINKLNL